MPLLRVLAAEWRLAMSPSSRQFVIWLLIFALILPLAGLLFKSEEPANLIQADLSLVSEEDHPLLDYLVKELENHPLVGRVYVDDLASAQEHLQKGEVVVYVQFPANFFATVGNIMKREQVHVVLSDNLKTESEVIARLFDAVGQTILTSSASYYAYYDLAKPFFLSPALLSAHFTQKIMEMVNRIFRGTEVDTHTEHPRFNLEAHVVASFFVILSIFAAFLPLIFTLRDERNGLSARFLSVGLTQAELIMSRFLCGLPFLVLSLSPVGALAILAFGYPLTPTLFLVVLLLYLGSGALLLALHSLWPTLSQGGLYLSYWWVMAQLLLGGVIYPNDLLPDLVKTVAQLSLTAPAHYSLFMHFAQLPYGNAIWHLAALSMLALLLLAGAEARRSRSNLL